MALPYDTELYLRRTLADFGTPCGESGLHYIQQAFSGNGATRVFTLSHSPNISISPTIYVNSDVQQSPEIYSISGTTLTFVVAPTNGAAILAVYEY